MRQAVNVMARELSTRDDLQPFMRDELRRMAEYLRPNAGRISQLRKLEDLRQSN